ncbi:MAG: endolytic transglycosylase MltG [Leptolyngbyaceae cyanobacterium MO_188.B28]|nr:endolytic transglycosylase MltG [Leptolyngbyaceae cyanobacterium MO_188.B28]
MKSGLWKGLFYLVLLPAAIGVSGWQGWAWWSWATSPVESPLTDKPTIAAQRIQIQIPQGTPAQQIGQDLESAGLIRSAAAWRFWTRWKAFQDPEGGFKAGVYALSPTQTLAEIADQIWLGDVVQLSFTIPEGWSRKQMAEALEAKGFFSASEFMNASSKIPVNQHPWLPQTLPHLEGFLYPDTYQLPAERITPEAVVFQMLKRFEEEAFSLYQQQSDMSLLEWVTLASIVEKEAVIPEERGVIAGVFTNRLDNDIPLGADPTVEYGLGIEQTPEQPLTWDQVNTPSPYNTYINAGLPPTPIASPGQASLEAALNPEKTDYLYFVARYDGTHVFSRTLAEHEAAQADIRDRIDSQGSQQ